MNKESKTVRLRSAYPLALVGLVTLGAAVVGCNDGGSKPAPGLVLRDPVEVFAGPEE